VDDQTLRGRYDAENVMNWDGPGGGGTTMILDPPGFSADGRHVFWKGYLGPPGTRPPAERKHFIVCDGIEGPSHDGLWIPEHFRNHPGRLRYVVRDGDRIRLVETAWWESITWQDGIDPSVAPSTRPAPRPAARRAADSAEEEVRILAGERR
jgi:hypothetical protein